MLAAVHQFGPSFSVKGAWEGTIEDLKGLPKGLDPSTSGGVAITAGNAELEIGEDGYLGLSYEDGPLSFTVSDSADWAANYTQDSVDLRLRGSGGVVDWDVSKSASVAGLGDVEFALDSDGGLEVGLTPNMPSVNGLGLAAQTFSNADGIAGRLEASSSAGGADLRYVVKNEAGDYDLANLRHLVSLAASVGGGSASAFYKYTDAGQNYNASFDTSVGGGDASLVYSDGDAGRSYNVSFSRALSDLIGSASDVALGVDDDGAYGALSVSRDLGDIGATVDVSGRVGTDGSNPSYAEALTLAHKLGSVTVSSADGGDIDVSGSFDIDQAGNKLHADVGYSLDSKEPTYNVTFSRDLSDVLKSAGDVEVGVDGDGVYGSVSASKALGGGFGLDYSSAGRADALEHKLKVSNDLGYAELVKAQDEDPRVRLGYEFEV